MVEIVPLPCRARAPSSWSLDRIFRDGKREEWGWLIQHHCPGASFEEVEAAFMRTMATAEAGMNAALPKMGEMGVAAALAERAGDLVDRQPDLDLFGALRVLADGGDREAAALVEEWTRRPSGDPA